MKFLNSKDKKELLFFAKIVLATVLAIGVSVYLAELGYPWLAPRFFISFFMLLMWIALIRCIRSGHLRPFYQSENPRWFAFVKYHHLLWSTLASFGVLWLWFN